MGAAEELPIGSERSAGVAGIKPLGACNRLLPGGDCKIQVNRCAAHKSWQYANLQRDRISLRLALWNIVIS